MNLEHTELTRRRFASFSVSMFAIGMVSVGWGAVDLAMITPFGTDHVAAVGLGEAVVMTIGALLGGYAESFSGRLAQAEGAGETHRRLPVLAGGFGLLLVPIAVLLVVAALLVTPFLTLIGQNELLIPMAASFIAVRLLGAVPLLVVTAFMETLKICGLQNVAVRALVLGLGLDVVFNALFLWGPMAGWFSSPVAALASATIAAQLVMGVYVGYIAFREFRRRGAAFVRPDSRAVWNEGVSMGKVGTGLGINQANDYAGATIPLLMIGTLSVPTVAAAAVATKIWTVYCRVPQACFTASFVFYGYAAGRDEAEARDVVRRLRGYSMAPTLIAAAVFLLASPLLVRLFGGSSIDMGLAIGLLGAYFLSIGGYFYGAFYGELLSVRQEGVFLSSRSTVVTYAVAIPLAAIAVFIFESAFLALASGAIPAALLAVMFARRIKELSAPDVEAAAA